MATVTMTTKTMINLKPSPPSRFLQNHNPDFNRRTFKSFTRHSLQTESSLARAVSLVHQFDPKIPLEEAVTPPSSWYIDPSFLSLEFDRVFYRGWQAVGSFLLPSIYNYLQACSHLWYIYFLLTILKVGSF